MLGKLLHRSVRERLKIFGPAGLITLFGFIAAYQYIGLATSDAVVVAAGEPEGVYYQIARRYQDILAREGITFELRNSAGSIERIALLSSDSEGVDVDFVQGGNLGLGCFRASGINKGFKDVSKIASWS